MNDTPPTPPADTTHPQYPDDDWYALIDYLTGEASPADHEAVQHRLDEDAAFAAFAAPIIQLWGLPRIKGTWDADANWAIIQSRVAAQHAAAQPDPAQTTPTAPPSKRRRPFPRFWPHLRTGTWATLTTAIVVITLLTSRAISVKHGHHYYEGGTTGATVTLSDGSTATLTPGSYLGTLPGFPTSSRELAIFGDVHFTVAANPRIPFVVHAVGVGARVLGTDFQIQTDTTPHIRVTVERGTVALETLDANNHWRQVTVLTAGQAQHVTIVQEWLSQVGFDLKDAGVPPLETLHIGNALRRAALHMGAAEAAHPVAHP